MSISTLAHNKAMAPDERSDCMEMSVGLMPQAGPRAEIVVHNCAVRVEVVMVFHWPSQ
jgi:hypothetical protein